MRHQAIRLGLVSLSLGVLVCGCATGSKFTEQDTPRAGDALLYVFRPSSPPYLLKPKIVVNGTEAAKLGSKCYLELGLRPGSYLIEADWFKSSGVPDSQMTLRAEAGQTYYLCVLPRMHNAGFVASSVTVVPIYKFNDGMELMDSDVALGALRQCSAVQVSAGVDRLINPQ